jgi:hypothetical protein
MYKSLVALFVAAMLALPVEGDTAVVFGTTELRFASAGKEDTISLLRHTATYIKREGQWRAFALQMAKREPK